MTQWDCKSHHWDSESSGGGRLIIKRLSEDSDLAADLDEIVTEIAIAGTATIPDNPPGSAYHFRFSLILADEKANRLDIQPGFITGNTHRGLLAIDSKTYKYSNSLVATFLDLTRLFPNDSGRYHSISHSRQKEGLL